MEFTAEQIAAVVGGEIRGDKNVRVSDVAGIEDAREGTLCFLNEEKYIHYLSETKASIVLMSRSLAFEGSTRATLILVDNARSAVATLLGMVSEVMHPRKKGVEQPCFIAEGVQVPEDAYIGAYAYIAKGVKLGKSVQIYPQCYLGENVKIGDNCILYAGAKVYYNCEVGNDCILHAGAVIGADGFGFEPDENHVNQKVPQIGNVVIEDDVEIGANSCVDRAMMGTTIVRKNTKIDNLVQIGHNCEVGESSFLCAQVGIAGSTKVGSHCIMAGQVGVAGHITIPDNTILGAQSGVAGTIRKPGMYMGSPAIDAAVWRRASVGFKNLPEMWAKLNELTKK
ncbi:MAG: UDP-3-O-(3-hydroxymyristoyl)glucosamine N-acyltransferase [Paludibacteraceae bacterium]|nr:UDP-3-O-(3-hydroxymyristoyl)glucosamine N-acyltransferase [Paludibacteraceae bacterium]